MASASQSPTEAADVEEESSAGTEKLTRKVYEKELRKLQVELCRLQDWVKVSGERVKPSGLTEEQVSEKASLMIERAMANGLSSVQVLRFPNHICTDGGRAINQVEEGSESTLTGIPKEIYGYWKHKLRPLGYHIVDYRGGMPGDLAIMLSWG